MYNSEIYPLINTWKFGFEAKTIKTKKKKTRLNYFPPKNTPGTVAVSPSADRDFIKSHY